MINGGDARTTEAAAIHGSGDPGVDPGVEAAEVATEASIEGNTVSSAAKR